MNMSNMLDTTKWQRFSGEEFNWFVTSDNTWIVRPTALSNHSELSEFTDEELESIKNPPLTNRAQNTIVTRENYVDFVMSLEFRCPNAREIFKVQHHENDKIAKTQGARNWGNSGIKIFNKSASRGAEIQIIDSKLDKWPSGDIHIDQNTGLNGCSSNCNGYLPFGQICGSIYMKHAARADPLKKSEGWPRPTGEWNQMEIEFHSRRTNEQGLIKQAKIHVALNGVELVSTELSHRLTDNKLPIWLPEGRIEVETGPIIIQEHDNLVEFRDIHITDST
jgi:hypothetical protein